MNAAMIPTITIAMTPPMMYRSLAESPVESVGVGDEVCAGVGEGVAVGACVGVAVGAFVG